MAFLFVRTALLLKLYIVDIHRSIQIKVFCYAKATELVACGPSHLTALFVRIALLLKLYIVEIHRSILNKVFCYAKTTELVARGLSQLTTWFVIFQRNFL